VDEAVFVTAGRLTSEQRREAAEAQVVVLETVTHGSLATQSEKILEQPREDSRAGLLTPLFPAAIHDPAAARGPAPSYGAPPLGGVSLLPANRKGELIPVYAPRHQFVNGICQGPQFGPVDLDGEVLTLSWEESVLIGFARNGEELNFQCYRPLCLDGCALLRDYCKQGPALWEVPANGTRPALRSRTGPKQD